MFPLQNKTKQNKTKENKKQKKTKQNKTKQNKTKQKTKQNVLFRMAETPYNVKDLNTTGWCRASPGSVGALGEILPPPPVLFHNI